MIVHNSDSVLPASVTREAVVAIAARAADLALEMQRNGLLNAKRKGVDTDIVTEADVASERLIRSALHDLDTGIGFWGEESNRRPAEDAYWLVDPIDGTVNFAHGLPYSAVNIALQVGGATVLGVTVQMPYRRIYWAERGQGAFLQEPGAAPRRLHVSEVPTLRAAFLATGFPYHNGEAEDDNSAEFVHFSPRCLGLRVLGAGAVDIAQVAAGILAGFWEGWLSPWDAAAGALLVREAGGRVTDYAGAEWGVDSKGLVASNGYIHDLMLEGIRTARTAVSERLLPV